MEKIKIIKTTLITLMAAVGLTMTASADEIPDKVQAILKEYPLAHYLGTTPSRDTRNLFWEFIYITQKRNGQKRALDVCTLADSTPGNVGACLTIAYDAVFYYQAQKTGGQLPHGDMSADTPQILKDIKDQYPWVEFLGAKSNEAQTEMRWEFWWPATANNPGAFLNLTSHISSADVIKSAYWTAMGAIHFYDKFGDDPETIYKKATEKENELKKQI